MAVRRLLDAIGGDAKGDGQRTDLVQGQRGVQRRCEHLTLMGIRVGRIKRDKTVQFCRVFGSEKVTDKEHAARGDDADHFGDAFPRGRNVVQDAVGHDDVEPAVVERQPLGIEMLEHDVPAEARCCDVLRGDLEHRLSQIGRRDVPATGAAA